MAEEVSQALYRKWRPQSWQAVIGQAHVVNTLRNALAAEKIGHAYLFAGPRGTGKTTTARLLAKAVNCLAENPAERPCDTCTNCTAVREGRFLDLIEIDAASNTSVEDVRDLRDKVNFKPNLGAKKIYIIDEVHMLSTAAFNALLKTLEEPPPHVIFILATTDAHKIPATVLSRCQRHEFRRIAVSDIAAHLKDLAQQENFTVAPEVLTLIARQSTGAMRDAISLLDQLASSGQAITLEMAQDVLGTAANQAVLSLVDAILARQPERGLDTIHAALDAGADARQFARQVVEYLRDLLLIVMKNADALDAGPDLRARMAQHAQGLSAAELLRLIRLFTEPATEGRATWQPALPLEMALAAAVSVQEPAAAPVPQPAAAAPAPSAALKPPSVAQPKTSPGAPADPQAAQRLSEAWPHIIKLARQRNTALYGAINSCKGRSLHGNKLTLFFASDVIKAKVEDPERMEMLRAILQQVFAQEIIIACAIDSQARDTVPPGVDDDGMVAAALRDLGGAIADPQ